MRLLGFQLCKQKLRTVELAHVSPQHRIDKTRLRAETGTLGQANGFMDSGMVGDAFKPEDLIESEPQQILQPRLLWARPRLLFDQPVERGPPAHTAINQFLAEAPIGGRAPGAGQ